MSRYHFRTVVRDANGTVLPNKSVELRNPGTANPIGAVLYQNNTGATALAQPLVSDNQGIVECYVENGRVADLFVVGDEVVTPNMVIGTRPSIHGGSWAYHIGSDGAPGITIDNQPSETRYYLIDRFPIGAITKTMIRFAETYTFDSRVKESNNDISVLTLTLGWYLNDTTHTDASFPLLDADYDKGPANAAGLISVPTNLAVGTWTSDTTGSSTTSTTFSYADFPKSVVTAGASKGETCYVDLILRAVTTSGGAWNGVIELKNLHIFSGWRGL